MPSEYKAQALDIGAVQCVKEVLVRGERGPVVWEHREAHQWASDSWIFLDELQEIWLGVIIFVYDEFLLYGTVIEVFCLQQFTKTDYSWPIIFIHVKSEN